LASLGSGFLFAASLAAFTITVKVAEVVASETAEVIVIRAFRVRSGIALIFIDDIAVFGLAIWGVDGVGVVFAGLTGTRTITWLVTITWLIAFAWLARLIAWLTWLVGRLA
jgi:hypothetical protein